jgi:hypothetical protein
VLQQILEEACEEGDPGTPFILEGERSAPFQRSFTKNPEILSQRARNLGVKHRRPP